LSFSSRALPAIAEHSHAAQLTKIVSACYACIMLALSDGALARIVIGASRIPVHARRRWLEQLAQRLDPPPKPATRQVRWRARHATTAPITAKGVAPLAGRQGRCALQ
jgi:hypothetical protein